MKLSSFIVSIVLVSLFVTVFGAYYAQIGTDYAPTYDDNTSNQIQAFDTFEDIQNVTEDINTTLFGEQTGETGTIDLLGKFLGSGFNVMKVAGQSFGAFYTLAVNATTAVGLPSYFLNIIVTVVMIIVFFIVVSALVGKDI